MTGWTIGFAIGGVVVLLVVVLLVTMTVLARRINAKAEAIHDGLVESRDHTRGLWELAATKATLDRVTSAAREAREALESRQRRPSGEQP